MLTLDIGLLAVPINRALLLLSFGVALLVGWLSGRRRGGNPEPALFAMLFGGLIAARLGFVLQYAGHYADSWWGWLDIRDGGFSLGFGVLGVLLVGLWQYWRRVALRRPLLLASTSGLLLWLALLGTFNQLQRSQQLPDFTLQDLQGAPVSLRGDFSQPLVINLWASWCPPCRREMPVLAEAQQRYPQVDILLVNQGEQAEEVRRYLQREGLALDNLLLDQSNRLGEFAGSRMLPTTLFFSADGRLVNVHLGELSSATLARDIAHLETQGSL
ncbi:MAG: TlpA disulfide reductase family protein [Halopseudomonas yangmingensis]